MQLPAVIMGDLKSYSTQQGCTNTNKDVEEVTHWTDTSEDVFFNTMEKIKHAPFQVEK